MIKKESTPLTLTLLLVFCTTCALTLSPMEIYEKDTRASLQTKDYNSLTIERAALATSMLNCEPKDIKSKFSAKTRQIYFFTHIGGAQKPTVIYHRWYYGGSLMAEVKLPVKRISWRTYSKKQIKPKYVGNWFVEAVDVNGNVLQVLPFEIK